MQQRKCREVTIRFNSTNHQALRLSRDQGPTATQYLLLKRDADLLSVQYIDKDGDVIREINYNFNHVLEYDCEGFVGVEERVL